jgi:hypothetical protein
MPSLPTQLDLRAGDDALDEMHAWRNFGGLTLDEARAKFREDPDIYQEDFMWMGGRAFAFYFPVIEEHLLNAPEVNEGDDHEAWILACGIRSQLDSYPRDVKHLAPRVLELAEFIAKNLSRFGSGYGERTGVARTWNELASFIRAACHA